MVYLWNDTLKKFQKKKEKKKKVPQGFENI